jgi:hypothetical protein
VLVSTYGFLAIAAVLSLIVLVIITGMLIKGAIEWLVRGYIAHRNFNLIDRELDRNPNVRLNEIYEARRYVDGDLPWVQPTHPIDDNHRPPLPLVDDNGFPGSEPPSKPLSASAEPDG